MNNITTINNLKYLASHQASKLAMNPDRTTLIQRKKGMAPLIKEELMQIIAHTERFYREKGRLFWIHLEKGPNRKRLRIETGRLLEIIKSQGLEKPLPQQELQETPIVTFIVNRQKIQADRELVAKASPVLDKMLFGGFTESKKDEIVLNEINTQDFRKFIAFTETEELPEINNPNHIIALYFLADRLQAETFEKALVKRLARIIKPNELKSISDNPRLFAQTVSVMGAENAQAIASQIHNFVKSLQENNEIQEKEALIFIAKQAMVAWINQAHIPIKDAAAGKKPNEFLEWLGPSLCDLEYADFENSSISDNDLDMLQRCPKLKLLDISFCNHLKTNALDVLPHFPNLRSLNITKCTQLKPDSLDVLEHCKNLEHLHIAACNQLNANALDVLRHCPNLLTLNINWCNQLNANALDALSLLPNLRSLDISFCKQLNEDALDVLRHCPNLLRLGVFGCGQFMQAARHLSEQRQNLKLIV